MKSVLLNRGRIEYIRLNKKFLEEVEKGASWDDLLPILAEMKSIAVWLQQVPTVTEWVIPTTATPPVENTPLAATDMEEPTA